MTASRLVVAYWMLPLRNTGSLLRVFTWQGKTFIQNIHCLQILPENSVQADVYQAAVQPVVEDVLNGYNGTIMAYGQTGAGKTYTLSSIQPDAIGMIPRAAAEVFAHIAKDVINEYTVFMSYIQIYMEMIQVELLSNLTCCACDWHFRAP